MKKRVIIAFICGFCILFCLNSILAANISLSYPAEVGFGGVFSLNFSLLDFNGLFDIKVDIFNSSDTLCSILAGASWQSCYNYLNDYINTSLKNSSTISLNITKNYVGVANLSVKVRNSVTSSTSTFSGFLINITSNNQTNTTTQTNQTNNQTTNTNTKTNTNNSKIYLEMDWDDEDILNNEEFEIKVSAFNLENYDYDLKLWIENLNEEGDIISERYDESNNEWKSGYYYIENFFSDSGNRTENILVRLNLDNSDFKGKAR
ncbi:hypothetical protein FJZ17_03040, partial [Candidatus Pacearchaeota archaeon]|nr:hypothetical protein [Candidatus Pacearchaeota archaeon]